MDERPFPELKIASSDILEALVGRSKCSKCNRSRKYYCYTCYVPVNEIKEKVPYVKLPVKIDVIKHPAEVDGKSTAAHAGVMAPADVNIYTYPTIPEYDRNKTVLVFPGENSVTMEQIAKELALQTKDHELNKSPEINSENSNTLEKSDSQPEKKRSKTDGEETVQCSDGVSKKPNAPFDTVVFIDSTWPQSKKIFRDERLSGMRHIEMKSYITKFWRYQIDKPNTYLATIEAIYYFVCEFHKQFVSDVYSGEYDNLLFIFNFMYHKIREFYEGGHVLKAFGGTGVKGDLRSKRNKEEAEKATEESASS